ncbi:MAG: hypothetical protein JWP11_1798 [Frankiales bacterium]|nr:hypothetical protein [Frankiales bacterium]
MSDQAACRRRGRRSSVGLAINGDGKQRVAGVRLRSASGGALGGWAWVVVPAMAECGDSRFAVKTAFGAAARPAFGRVWTAPRPSQHLG